MNFHDDVLTFVRIHPPTSRTKNLTQIEFGFLDYATGKKKTLSFHRCANFRFIMDFDVLGDQCAFGTEGSTARIDVPRMLKFVQSQQSHWRVEYMPPMPKDRPIRKKVKLIRSYVLFKLAFFGGTAEILAKTLNSRHNSKQNKKIASARPYPTANGGEQIPTSNPQPSDASLRARCFYPATSDAAAGPPIVRRCWKHSRQ